MTDIILQKHIKQEGGGDIVGGGTELEHNMTFNKPTLSLHLSYDYRVLFYNWNFYCVVKLVTNPPMI